MALAVVAFGCQAVIGEDFSEKKHACFPLSNAGCGDGQACVYAQDAAVPMCVAAGPGGQGALCSGTTGCAAKTTCFNTAGNNACLQYCVPGTDTCPVHSYCGRFKSLDGAPIGLCFGACDLLGATVPSAPFGGCPAGFGCEPTTTDTLRCFPVGVGEQYSPCTAGGNDCAKGFNCVLTPNGQLCLHWCVLGDNSACPGTTTCGKLDSPMTAGGVQFGVCS